MYCNTLNVINVLLLFHYSFYTNIYVCMNLCDVKRNNGIRRKLRIQMINVTQTAI